MSNYLVFIYMPDHSRHFAVHFYGLYTSRRTTAG